MVNRIQFLSYSVGSSDLVYLRARSSCQNVPVVIYSQNMVEVFDAPGPHLVVVFSQLPTGLSVNSRFNEDMQAVSLPL